MSGWAEILAVTADGVALAGVLLGGAVLVRTHSLAAALPVLLDLLLAAGLLRLNGDSGWAALAGAAAIILIRKVVTAALHRSGAPSGGSELPWRGAQASWRRASS